MNKLLIDDYPIQVLPALANEIGLNEAIILQQIHYWLNKTNHNYDGKRWIYNSYPKWIEQFPFWSESTIKRTITSLEKQNLLHIGNYNKAGFDRTKWYSINYIVLNELMTRPSGQNDPTKRSKWSDEEVNLNRPIPETTPETSSKTTSKDILSGNPTTYPYRDVIDYLNQRTGKNYKSTTKKNQTVIRARSDEGFSLDDFKRVIDNKVAEWKGTKMEKYLRPETLFGTKFEGYLNQELQPSGMDQLERMKYDESYWD
ncbi:phage protein [Staphylococcus epidermidis]|uniref:conserved phage C-terminal domain-containing protein n=1 Tax=Staphylococcus epidermidis TaxID=1282 RepID=UPI00193B3AC7|nr:conserved phage C-terminal domain-containing protein [Staphylococcus epidermidis]MBM6159236.1 phage protein [Staphylococcus epidermidis]MBM6161381.1 phage protein [Staphylococcus epidermidis]MBM6170360.1 phage protein [Staphylococcus epidermidis]MBM6177014.1 phage protein [Staphylococcus epidermidis]MBM6179274.1 phage protein [Staphylococcus epidermidis]